MPVLYRKYRPQTFSEMVGQTAIVQTLRNAVAGNSVAHAYLFTGSRGVGKTSVARILAKAINCLHPKDGDADGKCEICLAIADNNFLDLVEIDAASNTGVENVRELIEHVKFKPSRGAYKVFIIDEVHMLSKAAFNALLKTLEEPPAHAVFILATTDIHKVPETIISRAQRFNFQKISEADILSHLEYVVKQEKLGLDEEVLSLITTSAQGGLRDALSLLDKIASLGTKVSLAEAQSLLGVTSLKFSEQLVTLIGKKDTRALPAMFDELASSGTDFGALNRDLLEYLRKMLVHKVAGLEAKLDLLPEDYEVLQTAATMFSLPDLMRLIRLFLRSYKELAAAPSPELPLLLAAIEAAGMSEAVQTANTVLTQAPAAEPRSASVSKPVPQVSESELIVEEQPLDPLTLAEVNKFWPEVINKVKAQNSPLAMLLKSSPILEVSNSTITIGVRYLFNKENLESKKNYALITGAITEVSGKRVRLSVKITKSTEDSALVQSVDAIGDALKVFGGELVE